MNRSGLIRKLDKLGRVSIPAEIRGSLNIREGDMVEFGVDGTRIFMERYGSVCMVCGSDKDVKDLEILTDIKTGESRRFKVCRACMLRIRSGLEGVQT